MAGVKGKSGGNRRGAGRPRAYSNSDRFREELAAAELASVKAGDLSMAQFVIKSAKSGDLRTGLAAQRLFYDKVIIPDSEQKVETTEVTGPGIYLPEEKPVLAQVVPIKGEDETD